MCKFLQKFKKFSFAKIFATTFIFSKILCPKRAKRLDQNYFLKIKMIIFAKVFASFFFRENFASLFVVAKIFALISGEKNLCKFFLFLQLFISFFEKMKSMRK
jgi:hypothetical protein